MGPMLRPVAIRAITLWLEMKPRESHAEATRKRIAIGSGRPAAAKSDRGRLETELPRAGRAAVATDRATIAQNKD